MLKFRCPRCLALLQARSKLIGRKQRCPCCHFVFPVPTLEEIATRESLAKVTGYKVANAGSPSAPDSGREHITVTCDVCHTRISATPDQLGQQVECPDCGTLATIRRPEPLPGHAVEDVPHHEEYAVYDGAGQPPPSHKEVYRQYIAVLCSLCGTRMQATPEQAGESLTCPDCGTQTVVRLPVAPPPDATGVAAPQDKESEYSLSPRAGQPEETARAVYGPHFAAKCPRCGTRLTFLPEQAGQSFVCPDCQKPMTVPPPPSMGVAWIPEDPGEFHLRPPVAGDAPLIIAEALTETSPPRKPRRTEDQDDETEDPDEEEDGDPSELSPIPVVPMLLGVFTFPFYREMLPRWIAMTLTGTFIVYLAMLAARVAMVGFGAVVAVPMIGASGLLGLVWIGALCAEFLLIVRNTSLGYDHMVEWSEGVLFEWLHEALYLFLGLLASLLPGLVWAHAMQQRESVYTALSMLIPFPIVLLSMLEAGSFLRPLSWAILRSVWFAAGAWLLFYLASTLVVVLAGIVIADLGPPDGMVTLAVQMTLGLIAAQIYARLLGRLAWCCCRSLAEAEQRKKARQAAAAAAQPPRDASATLG